MNKKKLRGKKKLMYEALVKQMGVVTAAANLVGIDRNNHYQWMHNDPNYKGWIEDLPEISMDFAENALYQQIHKGNITAIIFYLKTKAKKRGYIEKQEIQISGSIDTLTNDQIETEVKRLLK